MKLRRIIFWLHLIAGVFAGIVVFLMSVTGVALTYQKQMTEWADRAFWPPAAPTQGDLLPVAELISKAATGQPEAKPAAITFYSDPEAPAMVAAQPGQNVFVNRYTGATRVSGSTAVRSFFRSATDLHRNLSMSGENRATGRAITGACNLAFLFIVSSGIYLWFPRNWSRPAVRAITWFKPGLNGKARDFNWHNTFGFWAAIPLFIIVLSGVVMSYPWANSMVYKIVGSPEPARNGGQRRAEGRGREGRVDPNRETVLDLSQLDSLLASAKRHSPGWRTIIAGQTIAGIASAAAAILVFTGLSLALRRLLAWNSRRRRSTVPITLGSLQEE